MDRKEFIGALGLGASAMFTSGCQTTSSAAALPDFKSVSEYAYWSAVRQQFPLGNDRVYLNCGGLGPAPSVVLDAVNEKTEELQAISETGHATMDEVRVVAAEYLGADANEICFTRNATESNSIIATGLRLNPGDEVIFESHAHPGGSFPWLNRQERHGIKVKVFDPDPESMEGSVERIRKLITPRTKVIQVSHITAPTGILFDIQGIRKLAQERGIWFHVDGAQTAGMIPIDLHSMDCDSYATSGHKWMGGPRGTGILYIKRSQLEEVECSHLGGHSITHYTFPDQVTYVDGVKRHEYGTRNTELVAGLQVAIEFQKEIGLKRIEAYGSKLANYLQAGLSEIPSIEILTPSDPAMLRSITTFSCSKIPYNTLTSRLMQEYRLRCRQVTEQGLNAVRVSTHIFNSKADCDRVIEAVSEIVRTA